MLLTKEQCDFIVGQNEAFYRRDYVIDGYEVVVYNYRLASISDFMNPTKTDREDLILPAFEMRGLTFVKHDDGYWERFLALSKFFNYGETLGWMPEDIDDGSVWSVHEKLDGSLIHFIRLPNGNYVAKTKQVFDSPQAQAANRILSESEVLQESLEQAYNHNKHLIFEYTAPDNQIVIPYQQEELTLLQTRGGYFGSYLDGNFYYPFIKHAKQKHFSIAELKELQKTAQGEEGWIANVDGKLVKFKTDWYFTQHRAKDGLTSSNAVLIELVLKEQFDDAISLLDIGFAALKAVLEYKASLVRRFFNHYLIEVQSAVNDWHKSQLNAVEQGLDTKEFKKQFVMRHKHKETFPVIIQVAEKGKDDVEMLAEFLLKKYNKESEATKLIERLLDNDKPL